jgi:hypothetical protein
MASAPSIPGATRSPPSASIAPCARCATPGSNCRAIAAAACSRRMPRIASRRATTTAAPSTKPRRWARPASCWSSAACRNIRGRAVRPRKTSRPRARRSTTPSPRCWNTRAGEHAAGDRAAASGLCRRPRLRQHDEAGARYLRPLDPQRTGALGVALDVYHIWWDPELLPQIARAGKDRLLAFHVCDWLVPTKDILNDRGMMGDGVIDIKSVRAAVEAQGFAGYSEIEIFSNDWWSKPMDEVLRDLHRAARHAQKSAEAHPAAAHRLAGERIIRKAREETRDRDRALEPRQRHAGALMRAGAEGQMPVRRAADIEVRDRRTARDRGWRRRCTASPACPAGIAMPPSSNGSTVMRLPSWLELSNRSISSTAVLISAGFRSAAVSRAGSTAPPGRCRSDWWWSRGRH